MLWQQRVAYRTTCMKRFNWELRRMVEFGVIREVNEPTSWCSPMVVVPKKDQSVRICVDYTRLNEDIQRERYQLPLAEEIFSRLSGATYFTTPDAASGFWQIPLDDSSSDLTTFLTPFGRFKFTRLPFGLVQARRFSTEQCSRFYMYTWTEWCRLFH